GGDDDDDADGPDVQISLPDVPDWTRSQKLAFEKECLGFYLTSHPLTQHSARIERYAQVKTRDIADMDDTSPVTIAGMVGAIKIATAKKASVNGLNKYANFDLEDASGIIRCIAWPADYERFKEMIKTENVVIVQGKVDRRNREPNIIVNRLLTLDQADREFTKQVAIKFDRSLHTTEDIDNVRRILSRFPGSTDVVLVVDSFTGRNGLMEPGLSSTVDDGSQERSESSSAADASVAGDENSGDGEISRAEVGPDRVRYILTTGKDCQVTVGPEFQQALRDTIGEDFYELKAAATTGGQSGSVGR
ncbi:MAG: hypothetical protein KDA89_00155, partial [Planctomycetaceae bacterium]|nr:hypothetical protein [Planctomycetaceae bacterium]